MDIDSMLNETSEEIKKNWASNEIDVQNRQKVVKHFGSIQKVHKMSKEEVAKKLASMVEKLDYEDIEDMANSLEGMGRLTKSQRDSVVDKAAKFSEMSDEEMDSMLKDYRKKVKPSIGIQALRAKNKIKKVFKGKK